MSTTASYYKPLTSVACWCNLPPQSTGEKITAATKGFLSAVPWYATFVLGGILIVKNQDDLICKENRKREKILDATESSLHGNEKKNFQFHRKTSKVKKLKMRVESHNIVSKVIIGVAAVTSMVGVSSYLSHNSTYQEYVHDKGLAISSGILTVGYTWLLFAQKKKQRKILKKIETLEKEIVDEFLVC
jgi:hypothetical protein